jgi:hypothetical protein
MLVVPQSKGNRMRQSFALLVVVLTALASVASSQAATSDVSLSTCHFSQGGQTTVPAGATVRFQFGYGEPTQQRVRKFLRLQQTTASIDGTPIANASALWGPITQVDPALWVSFWRYTDGTLLNAGDSISVVFDVTFTKRYRSGDTVYQPGDSLFGGPISCRITAV